MPFIILPGLFADEYTTLTPIAVVDLRHLEYLRSRIPLIVELHREESDLAEVAIWNPMAVWYNFSPDEYVFCEHLDNNQPVIVDELPEEIRDLTPEDPLSDYPHRMSVDLKEVIFCGQHAGDVSFQCNIKDTSITIATPEIDLDKIDEIPRYCFKEAKQAEEDAPITIGTEGEYEEPVPGKTRDPQCEDPEYPETDWIEAVRDGHTRLGYWEWVDQLKDADSVESE